MVKFATGVERAPQETTALRAALNVLEPQLAERAAAIPAERWAKQAALESRRFQCIRMLRCRSVRP